MASQDGSTSDHALHEAQLEKPIELGSTTDHAAKEGDGKDTALKEKALDIVSDKHRVFFISCKPSVHLDTTPLY